MAFYEGRLKRLGSSENRGNFTIYSLIEIGDDVLTKVTVSNKLDTFLRDGLQTSEPVKLWTIKNSLTCKGLAAVQIANGKKYISRPFSLGDMVLPSLSMLLASAIAGSFNIYAGLAVFLFTLWCMAPIYEYSQVPGYDATKL
jgi:hypothetical protein